MVKFGLIKSKIEKHLTDSYQRGSFKYEMKNFKTKVLENKNISKAFHLYNELSDCKNLNESTAKDFVDECIRIYESLDLKKSEIDLVNKWLSNVVCENNYKDIDQILSKNVLNVIEKVQSKNRIVETLMSSPKKIDPVAKIPVSSMLNIANKTFSEFISKLDESEKKELLSIISLTDEDLNTSFIELQEKSIKKLEGMIITENDEELNNRISETIENIKNQKSDKISFFKLKNLYNSI